MKLRSTRTWGTKNKQRVIRLYRAWLNMRQRCNGQNHTRGMRPWIGLPIYFEWMDFDKFREWALTNGYSRERCSLERKDSMHGYGPGNCEWITRQENSRRARQHKLKQIRLGYGRPNFAVGIDVPRHMLAVQGTLFDHERSNKPASAKT